jgi:hypothetical protein
MPYVLSRSRRRFNAKKDRFLEKSKSDLGPRATQWSSFSADPSYQVDKILIEIFFIPSGVLAEWESLS